MTIINFSSKSHNSNNLTSFLPYDPYIERFWQPILGPTATGLLNLLAIETLINNDFNTSSLELSRRTGTGARDGNSSPVIKQLKRLSSFRLIQPIDENRFKIASQIPPLSERHIAMLTIKERTHHEIWLERLLSDPLQTQLNKATHLIIVMTMMGYSQSAIEISLMNSGLHPCVIGQLTKMYPISEVS